MSADNYSMEHRKLDLFYANCENLVKLLSDHAPHTKATVMEYLGLTMGVPEDEEDLYMVLKNVNRHHNILKVPIYVNEGSEPEVAIGYKMFDKDLLDREWEQFLNLKEVFGDRDEMELTEYLELCGCNHHNASQSISYFKELSQMLSDGSITINRGKVTFIRKFAMIPPALRKD